MYITVVVGKSTALVGPGDSYFSCEIESLDSFAKDIDALIKLKNKPPVTAYDVAVAAAALAVERARKASNAK